MSTLWLINCLVIIIFTQYEKKMFPFFQGEVYPIDSWEECPLTIPVIPPEPDYPATHMLQMWVTDYLPNSAGYSLQKAGVLQYNVTPDNVRLDNLLNYICKHFRTCLNI